MGMRGYFEGVDPFVDIDLENSAEPTKVLVDTGFTGELILQREKINSLGLVEVGEDVYTTASGAEVKTTIHIGSLNWLGETKKVSVLATEGKTALLGMGLLFHHCLRMKPSEGILQIE